MPGAVVLRRSLDIAAFQKRRSRRCSETQHHGTSGRAFHPRHLNVQTNIDAIEMEEFQESSCDVFVLARKQLWATLQNGKPGFRNRRMSADSKPRVRCSQQVALRIMV